MSNYSLNGISLSGKGFKPGQFDNSNLAITGAWDMPARIGKTYHDWGNDLNNIEPYVLEEEIRFGGRDISLKLLIKANSKHQALNDIYSLYKDIDAFNGLVPLVSDKWGSWNVYVKAEISANYVGNGLAELTLPFREPIVNLNGTLPHGIPDFSPIVNGDNQPIFINDQPLNIGSINYDGYGIDGVKFKHIGITVLRMIGQFNRPAPKSFQSSSYSNEGFKITKSGIREILLTCLIIKSDYQSFISTIKSLYALFSKPGLRYITKENDALRDFFVKDGFSIKNVRVRDRVSAIMEVKLSEVSVSTNWGILTDATDTEILTEFGNIIIT